MKIQVLLHFLLILLLLIGAVYCSDGDDDDDNDDSDDDDDSADDDSADDDTADDDTADDDTVDDDTSDDDTGDDDTDLTGDIFTEDFENYTLNAYPSFPWEQYGGSGTSIQRVIADPTKGGQLLEQNGGTTMDDYFYSYRSFQETAQDMQVDFMVYPTDGAEWGFELYQFWLTHYIAEVEVVGKADGSLHVWDKAVSQWVDCGAVVFDQWQTVSVMVYYNNGTFDLYYEGTATTCTGIGMEMGDQTPLSALGIRDFWDDGAGGIVYFDNMTGNTLDN